jgi:uncharacterized protein (DUF983 family)
MSSPEPPPPQPRPTIETLLGRGLRLKCPRCGEGRLFEGWMQMPERCSGCGLKYERAPGYFLGSAYINYGITALILMISYFVLHFGVGWTNTQLAFPLAAFCVIFPLWLFRYARAIWLAFDCHFDANVMSDETS